MLMGPTKLYELSSVLPYETPAKYDTRLYAPLELRTASLKACTRVGLGYRTLGR